MGLGIGRKFKKFVKKTVNKTSLSVKLGIGADKDGKWDPKLTLDPAGVFTGKADLFHQKLGIGVELPKISGMGTDPKNERLAAEAQASQNAARMLANRKRLLRKNSLSAGGAAKTSASLSSVLAYGKAKTGE